MENWFEVFVLGLIEGLTEFLPISSTAHLLIAADLLGFRQDAGGTFEIAIQLGAIVAVLGFYARDLVMQARALPRDVATQRFWLGVLIAFLPAALIGVALRTWIKTVLFGSPLVIAWALISGGILFLLMEYLPHRQITTRDLQEVSFRQALGIGVAQVFALIPGVSRSGASIIGGILGGLDRATATRFSFYLAIPTLGAATLLELVSNFGQLTSGDLGRLALGALTALIIAWVSIGWLLRYVAHHSFRVFGIYRIIAGIIVLLLVALGRI